MKKLIILKRSSCLFTRYQSKLKIATLLLFVYLIQFNTFGSNAKEVECLLKKNINYNIKGLEIELMKIGYESSDKQTKFAVKGVVLDDVGNPLAGATILEKGTDNGASADIDGNFRISVNDESAILIVSFIGYQTLEVSVTNEFLRIKLKLEANSLDDIIVVGYGTKSRKKVTGSISRLDVSRTEKSGFLSTNDVLQGRISGVQIASTSGTPGGQQRINIRGIGSLQGDNQPLVVIDGIPINSSDPSTLNNQVFGSVNNQSPLALLNPNDIANIDVLKDASSTAIYGSRGTNGVILITTKKGSEGKAKVSYSSYYGFQMAPSKIKMADTKLWLEVNNEAIANYNTDLGLSVGDKDYKIPLTNPLASGTTEYDWTKGITNDISTIYDHNITITGGNKKTKYYVSLGAFSQDGWFRKSNFKRLSTKFNVEHKFNDKVKFGINFIGNFVDNSRVASHEGGLRLLIRSLEQRPADRPYLDDGSYNIGGSATLTRHNGVQVINEQESTYKTYRGILSTFVEFKLFEGFSYKPSFNIDFGTYHDNTFRSPLHPRGRRVNGQVFDSRNISTNNLFENLFTYSKKIDELNIDVTVGHSFQQQSIESSLIDARNFPSPSFSMISSAATSFSDGSKVESALDSYLARFSATYRDKYLLNLAVRIDGSSKFAEGKKYGGFPSASFGWILSEESFFEKNNIISFAKLRISYGLTGSTSSIGYYNSLALVSGGADYLGLSGLTASQLNNPDLTWEKSGSFNVGLDLRLLKDRISISTEYYTKTTDDLLYDRPIHGSTGFTVLSENIGSLKSNGFELGIDAIVIQKEDFSWNMNVNFSTVNNELTSLISNDPIPLGYNVLQVGKPVGSFYLLKMTGIYQSDGDVPVALAAKGIKAGDVIYDDVNNDGNITADDRQIVGNAFPDFYGGINSTFEYKSFDLNIFSNFSIGNDIYAAWKSGGYLSGGAAGSIRVGGGVEGLGYTQFGQLKETAEKRWTENNKSNTTPRAITTGTGAATHNNQASSRWVEDGSFLRIKSITLGYTLPDSFNEKISIDKLRVYITANNLFAFTQYSGYDPEVSDSSDPRTFGADFLTAPPLRTIIFGLNVNF